ncbi:hypothetical protein BGY98DRAFT_1013734 [Russula aff. rugulosa BPL654]|nr:hypothetical protein BGY98DRAFT_1015796 [Russula aff. rugulosa BPL654]KAI0269602.1 hypothetical protein BGY98DRAFT_1013734 [Russula aff. rugulosa BPL654]
MAFSASESVLLDLQSRVFRLATIVVLVFYATLASSHCLSASRSSNSFTISMYPLINEMHTNDINLSPSVKTISPARPRTSTRVSMKGNFNTPSSPKHVPLDEPILPLCT